MKLKYQLSLLSLLFFLTQTTTALVIRPSGGAHTMCFVQFKLFAQNTSLANLNIHSLILKSTCGSTHKTMRAILQNPDSVYAHIGPQHSCRSPIRQSSAVELEILTRDGRTYKCGKKRGTDWINVNRYSITKASIFLNQLPDSSLTCSWTGQRIKCYNKKECLKKSQ